MFGERNSGCVKSVGRRTVNLDLWSPLLQERHLPHNPNVVSNARWMSRLLAEFTLKL